MFGSVAALLAFMGVLPWLAAAKTLASPPLAMADVWLGVGSLLGCFAPSIAITSRAVADGFGEDARPAMQFLSMYAVYVAAGASLAAYAVLAARLSPLWLGPIALLSGMAPVALAAGAVCCLRAAAPAAAKILNVAGKGGDR